MIARAGASDPSGLVRRTGATTGRAAGFQALLKTGATERRRPAIAVDPVPTDAVRTPLPCIVGTMPATPLPEETRITRADLTGLAAVERAVDATRTMRKELCVSIDTGAGTVVVRVVPENGALRVELSPDPRVPQATRLAIVDAIRRKAPGAAVRDHGGRPR